MLFRFLIRSVIEISWRLSFKALWLWCWKGYLALGAFKKRRSRGILFPPFLFISLTNLCNLRCRGCWIAPETSSTSIEFVQKHPVVLPLESIEKTIQIAQKQSVYFYTLLGGEPFLAPTMWKIIERHPEAYFQIITNGQFLDTKSAERIKKLGNISPLISIDGLEIENDARRGAGTFMKAVAACRQLQKQKILYGIATTVTGQNFEQVLNKDYVQYFIGLGAMYLWFYIYRPVGADSAPELAVNREQLLELRRRLIQLRHTMPIILIDTYWDANGKAVCPASKGMAFVIGSQGDIEPCPPMTAARNFLHDNNGDFYKTINESEFLRRFMQFIRHQYGNEDSQGCVILDYPQQLADFLKQEQAIGTSGRNFLAELESAVPQTSHYLPGEEIPEDQLIYRTLKKFLFFGMGAYG